MPLGRPVKPGPFSQVCSPPLSPSHSQPLPHTIPHRSRAARTPPTPRRPAPPRGSPFPAPPTTAPLPPRGSPLYDPTTAPSPLLPSPVAATSPSLRSRPTAREEPDRFAPPRRSPPRWSQPAATKDRARPRRSPLQIQAARSPRPPAPPPSARPVKWSEWRVEEASLLYDVANSCKQNPS